MLYIHKSAFLDDRAIKKYPNNKKLMKLKEATNSQGKPVDMDDCLLFKIC